MKESNKDLLSVGITASQLDSLIRKELYNKEILQKAREALKDYEILEEWVLEDIQIFKVISKNTEKKEIHYVPCVNGKNITEFSSAFEQAYLTALSVKYLAHNHTQFRTFAERMLMTSFAPTYHE